jgi:AhpD family alkylhydroperoxidase
MNGDKVVFEKITPWYALNSPEIGQPFQDFNESSDTQGVLDKKTKELLKISLACAFRCYHCTESHIKKALEAGATKEEITEALLITAVEAAGTQINWAEEIYLKYLGNSSKK